MQQKDNPIVYFDALSSYVKTVAVLVSDCAYYEALEFLGRKDFV